MVRIWSDGRAGLGSIALRASRKKAARRARARTDKAERQTEVEVCTFAQHGNSQLHTVWIGAVAYCRRGAGDVVVVLEKSSLAARHSRRALHRARRSSISVHMHPGSHGERVTADVLMIGEMKL